MIINVMKNARGSRILAIIDSLRPTNTNIVKNTSTRIWSAVTQRFL